MKRRIYSLFIALSLLVVSACDLDLQNDPNAVTADTASLNLVLNRIQLDFTGFYNGTQDRGMRLTRMLNQGSNLYEQAYVPVNFNGTWTTAYANILNDIKFLEPLAEEADFKRHLGIARVIKAYVLMTMVDYFNDVPWSEALDPNNFNPNYDQASAVYAAALEALTLAKENFAAPTSAGAAQDLFYGGTWANWVKLTNSMILKLQLNRKLVDAAGATSAINALIAENNFIQPGQEFVFKYGTNLTDPDSRHPRFAGQYTPGGGGDYQSTWYMWHMTEEKVEGGAALVDPRARFYFYRQQIVNPTDPDKLRCLGEIAPGHYLAGGFPFCLPGTRGYWGRDHLNAEGIPPDNLERTAWGVYPAGGRFDNNAAAAVNPNAGAGGAGIHPIMLPSYVDFMLAEAAQTLPGVSGDPAALLRSGIQKSINYVRAFSVSTSEESAIKDFQADADFNADRDAYLDYVADEFEAASEARKMYFIGREYWLALFGNGNESYNLYRRTGQPDGMQPGLLANFGDFPRSLFYPNNHLVTNTNAVQKASQRLRVFWDTNPEGNDWVY
ncbi:SusD/RagB family nutrient-binding outer membrane lipoprotein [Aquiflexum lacus]|uniref:SusD/RagB family nutrient-binding outer membrane lipoprotein n=1 Tax=Aquiflexum lacus TaxID=2483805 RepID=UPI0018950815|nr:SusD/RagB family nutrient-binding outer membrane lipoprotein [Aquiflexum lacus]